MGDIVSVAAEHFGIDGANKGGCRRFYCEAQVRDGSDDVFYSGFSQDITRSGVFVATYDIRPVGTEAAVRVIFDGADDYGVDCVVEWVREPHPLVDDVPPGMGLRFRDFDPDFAARFNEHVREHPPYFVDTQGPAPSRMAVEPLFERPPDDLSLDMKALRALEKIRERLFELNESENGRLNSQKGLLTAARRVGWSDPPRHWDLEAPFGDVGFSKEREPISSRRCDAVREATALGGEVDACLDVCATGEYFDRQFRGGFEDKDGPLVAFVRSGVLRPVGCRLAVTMVSGGREVGALIGRVRWRRRVNPALGQTNATPGIGLRFEEVLRGTAEGLGDLWNRGCPVLQEV